jgi:nucleoside-diphosphate-sugar epimerase
MRVVVTGAAGGVGRALIPRLLESAEVSDIIGIDRVPMASPHPRVSYHQGDIQFAALGELLGADALVHLAFCIAQGSMNLEQMWRNNVDGSLRVFRAARAAGIRKIINLSSASIYGHGENLDELAPLNPPSWLPYAQHKVALERVADDELRDIELIHLRPTYILGPHATPWLKRLCTARFYISPPRPHPKIQVVHEDDVALAIVAALTREVPRGAYNLAAPEVLTMPQVVRNGRKFVLPLPIGLLERFVGPPAPDGGPRARPAYTILDVLRMTVTVSCRRAQEVLRWTPRYSAWQARASLDSPA